MKRFTSLFLAIILVVATVFIPKTAYGDTKDQFSIVFTQNIESNLQPKALVKSGNTSYSGGYGKLKTAIDQVKAQYPTTFVLDGGNFSMGTPFQTIYTTEASELIMLGQLGYDVVALGVNEFNYGLEGAASMIAKAATKVGTTSETTRTYNKETYKYDTVTTTTKLMPDIVQSNIDWEKTISKNKEKATQFKAAMDGYGALPYTVVERSGVKIAVFSIMDKEAIGQSPNNGVTWKDGVPEAKKIVDEIKSKEQVDLIVCLSQGGLDQKGSSGIDVDLAKAVPGIDLIISGNSHTVMDKPLTVGTTTIISCGDKSNYLGQVVFKKEGDKYKVESYNPIPMDDKIVGDTKIQAMVDQYQKLVDVSYFGIFGYKSDYVVASSSFSFKSFEKFGKSQGEEPLGDMIADSYVYAVEQAEGSAYEKMDLAIVTAGSVTGSLGEGPITAGDLFNVTGQGQGPDSMAGYPLVTMYLTGKEVKALIEADISISPKMPEARLYMSGVSYSYNERRLFLNKATDIRLVGDDGTLSKIDNKKLYRVVGSISSWQMIQSIEERSKGLLSIKPKDKEGKEITNIQEHIVYTGHAEVKEWYALATYMDSFQGKVVPDKYKDGDGRKADKTSLNPFSLLKQPNNFGVIVGALVMIPIVIIGGVIFGLRRRRYRRRGYGRSMFRQKSRPRGGKPVFKERKIRMGNTNRMRIFDKIRGLFRRRRR